MSCKDFFAFRDDDGSMSIGKSECFKIPTVVVNEQNIVLVIPKEEI